MQTKREHKQHEMMLLPSMESLIPQDHNLRRLNRVLDLSFVHDAVRDRYCQDNGRPSIDPEVVVRLFLIQAMDGISHVRELMRQVQVNLAYRWFIGYRLDEKLPDHSTLSKALDRLGDNVFNELFERSISQCKKSGLIEGRVLHVDATTIRADLDCNRVGKPDSPDRDARFGRFPDGKKRPGYKQQTVVDGKKRVVVGLSVHPCHRRDDVDMVEVVDKTIERLERVPEAVCADSAYGNGPNSAALRDRGIRLVSPPPIVGDNREGSYFSTEDFDYDSDRDEFTCPSESKLKYRGRQSGRPNRRLYRARESSCKGCALKASCTPGKCRHLNIGTNHDALVRLRADSRTEDFQRLYRSRAPAIEGVFGEAKQWHGLGRAWRRGLSKMLMQCLLIATVINLKRQMARFGGLKYAVGLLVGALRNLCELISGEFYRKQESTVQIRCV